MKTQLSKEQIKGVAELFEYAGDYDAITTAIKMGFKHDKLDYLLELNNKYGWDDSWVDNETLEEYLQLKQEIFKDAFEVVL